MTRGAVREAVVKARQELAWLNGMCGVRFGHLGVCDEPAGHAPIAPPHWLHASTVSGGGPLGDLLEQLR